MRALILLLPLALAGGLYLWFSQRTTAPDDVATPGVEAPAAPEVPEAFEPETVDLQGLREAPKLRDEAPVRPAVDARYPLEVDLVLIQPGQPDASDKEMRAGAKAVLRGRLHDDHGAPIVGRVIFEAGANKGRELACASDGTFLASDLYPGLSIVRADSGRGYSSLREVRLGQFGNTELNIAFGPRSSARVTGRVQNERGEPIADAQVSVDGQRTTTNEEGRFEVYRTTAGQILVEVEAEGFALYREQLPVARGAQVDPDRLVFQLEKEAILDLEVLGNVGTRGPALVYLFPAGGQRINSMRGQRTFPWYRINPIEVQPGLQNTIRGLAPGHVTVMAFKPGAIAKPEKQNQKLNAGKRASLKIELVPGPSLTGRVVREGKPVAGALVRLEALDASQASMAALARRPSFNLEMVVDILPAALQVTHTDAAGRFLVSTQPTLQNEYVLWVSSADGKFRSIQRIEGEALTQDLEVELKPVETGTGQLELALPGVGARLPYRVRINGETQDVRELPIGEPIVIDDLPEGLWRLDLSRYQNYAERGVRFWITPDRRTEESATIGQDLWQPQR